MVEHSFCHEMSPTARCVLMDSSTDLFFTKNEKWMLELDVGAVGLSSIKCFILFKKKNKIFNFEKKNLLNERSPRLFRSSPRFRAIDVERQQGWIEVKMFVFFFFFFFFFFPFVFSIFGLQCWNSPRKLALSIELTLL